MTDGPVERTHTLPLRVHGGEQQVRSGDRCAIDLMRIKVSVPDRLLPLERMPCLEDARFRE